MPPKWDNPTTGNNAKRGCFILTKKRGKGEENPALRRACASRAPTCPPPPAPRALSAPGKEGGAKGALTQHLLTQLDKEHKPRTAPILVLALRRPFKDGDGETDQLGLVYSPARLSSSSDRGWASFPGRQRETPCRRLLGLRVKCLNWEREREKERP